jgi:hypothetical protein
MTTYSDSEAKTRLDELLADAQAQGEVRIRDREGRVYAVRPVRRSPLDVGRVEGVSLTAEEIVEIVRESREGR